MSIWEGEEDPIIVLRRTLAENERLRSSLDEIEAKIEQLRAALKPFAVVARAFAESWKFEDDDLPLSVEHAEAGDGTFTIGDMRRAAAIEQTPQGEIDAKGT